MSLRIRLAIPVIAFAATSAVTFAAPDESHKGPNAGTKGAAESSAPVETTALANRLARYGIRAADSIAIVQAAKMKISLAKRVLNVTKSVVGKGTKVEKPPAVDLSPEALLKRAEKMAGANPAVMALIKDARNSKSRGAVRGPSLHDDLVLPGDTDIYAITFRAGEQATVYVNGDGDTDLDLYVQDENGNDICADTDETDSMICRWTPSWTGQFRVRIKNLGKVYNRYELFVN